MKKVRISFMIGLMSTLALPAFAMVNQRVDDSHLLTYLFLGLCALIVLFQLVPVFSMVRDLLKGSLEAEPSLDLEEAEALSSKPQQ